MITESGDLMPEAKKTIEQDNENPYQTDTFNHQEINHPTILVPMKINGRDKGIDVRRRESAARWWGSLSQSQTNAAQDIRAIWDTLWGAGTLAPVTYELKDKSYASGDHGRDLLYKKIYTEWLTMCERNGIIPSAIVEMIDYIATADEVARTHRRKRGWGMHNLRNGLDLFVKVKMEGGY